MAEPLTIINMLGPKDVEMELSRSVHSDLFVKVKEGYQVHIWNDSNQSKGILASADTGRVEHLSSTLAKALRFMDGRRRIDEIARAFSIEYEVPLLYSKSIIRKVAEQFVLEDIVDISSVAMRERTFSKPLTSPFHLTLLQIQVTNKCNLYCLHCYAESGKAARKELSTQDILNLISEFSDMGGVKIFLTGGEPLVHPELDTIIAHAKKLHLFVYLSTNGYTVTEKRVDRLVELGVGAVNVSIDGCIADTHDTFRGKKGVFEKAMRAIDLFLSKGVACASQTTLFTGNLDQCVDIVNTLRPRGVSKCYFVRMLPSGRGAKHLDLIPTMEQYRIYREKEYRNRRLMYGDEVYPHSLKQKKWRCSAAVSQIYVQANGHCYPCPSLATDMFSLGKYPDSKLKKIWTDESGKLLDIRAFNSNKIEKCQECEHKRFCRGGCFGNALTFTGDWRQPDPHTCISMDSLKRVQRLAPRNSGN